MRLDEAKQFAVWVAKLFPSQITPEQARFLRDELLPFRPDAATRAIKAHRAAHEFFSGPQLIEGCRAAERGATSAPQDNGDREPSWCDVRRRQNPQLGNAGDYEVVVRVHRQWWNGRGKPVGGRPSIEGSCRRLLAACGMEPEAAGTWAAYAMDAEPRDFPAGLDDLRQWDSRPATDPDRPASSVAVIRESAPATYERMDDAAAVIHFYAAAWGRTDRAAAGETGTAAARSLAFAHCRNALAEAGKSPAEASAMARAAVGLRPGERIVLRGILRPMPEPVAEQPARATKALAAVGE